MFKRFDDLYGLWMQFFQAVSAASVKKMLVIFNYNKCLMTNNVVLRIVVFLK